MKLAVLGQRFPLDAHQPIEVHAFGLEPGFEGFARVRAEFHEHFSFQHVDQHALGVRGAAALHALREIFRALAGEASERVLREIARHEGSRVEVEILSIPYRAQVRTAQGTSRGSWWGCAVSAEEKALLQRYTRQLDEQETRLDGLRKKIQETEGQRDKENELLEKMIDALQIEATM